MGSQRIAGIGGFDCLSRYPGFGIALGRSISVTEMLRQQSCAWTYNMGGGIPGVSISVQIIFGILITLGYLVTPVALTWGWTRWARQPKQKTVPAILSLLDSFLQRLQRSSPSRRLHTLKFTTFLITIRRFSGYFGGEVCFPSPESCLASVVYCDRGRCAGTRLFVDWECAHSGWSQQKVSDRTDCRRAEPVVSHCNGMRYRLRRVF